MKSKFSFLSILFALNTYCLATPALVEANDMARINDLIAYAHTGVSAEYCIDLKSEFPRNFVEQIRIEVNKESERHQILAFVVKERVEFGNRNVKCVAISSVSKLNKRAAPFNPPF